MALFLNIFTAWLSVILLLAVVIIWILRVLIKKKVIIKGTYLFGLNRTLRINHKRIGIAFLAVSLIHGLFSSAKIFSTDWGSITFFVMVIMSASYMIKSKIKRLLWVYIHRFLTVAVVILTIIHLLDVGIVAHVLIKNAFIPKHDNQLTRDALEDEQFKLVMQKEQNNGVGNEVMGRETSDTNGSKVYLDGVYQGVADAYGPALTVEVTIKDDIIKQVLITSHNEVGERFYIYPMTYLPPEIEDIQTPLVDSISGATMTSVGIKNAAIDALNKAAISDFNFEMEELPQLRRGRRG